MDWTSRLVVVVCFFCCVITKCQANPAPEDPCKTGDDGAPKDCRATTEVEKCPNQSEWYDEKFDGVTFCCCRCGEGHSTYEDPKSIICHQSEPNQNPDFTTTSAHPTPEKANTEPRFDDTSTVPLKVMPDPETTSLPPETATTPGRSTSDPNVTTLTSPGQESEKVLPNDQNGLPTWAVVLIVIGALLLALAIGILIVYCWKKKNSLCCQSSSKDPNDPSLNDSDDTELQPLN